MKNGAFAAIALAMSAYCWWTVVIGIKSEKINPISRGWPGEIERADYPKGFWAGVCWNAFWGLFTLFLAVEFIKGLSNT